MKAIILAAGEGTRLKKYTQSLPKGMLEFQGKSIIQHQLEILSSCGINDVCIVKGFEAGKIDYPGIKYYTNHDFAVTNMVESMLCAKEEFDDDIILSYSDILYSPKLIKDMVAAKGDYCVATDDNWKFYWLARYGRTDYDTESLKIDNNDNIISLGIENPPPSEIDSRYIGLLKFSTEALENIVEIMKHAYSNFLDKPWQQSGKTAKKAYMTDLIQAVIECGKEVKAVRFNNGWIEFDTNEDYEKACEWAKTGFINQLLHIGH